MAFELQLGKPLSEELTRLLDEQIDGSLADLKGTPDEDAIHTARRHIKKARAVLRLLDGDLQRQPPAQCDRQLRAAGRALSASRDAAVLLHTLDALAESSRAKATTNALQRLRETLQAQDAPVVDTSALQTARHALQEFRSALTGHTVGERDSTCS